MSMVLSTASVPTASAPKSGRSPDRRSGPDRSDAIAACIAPGSGPGRGSLRLKSDFLGLAEAQPGAGDRKSKMRKIAVPRTPGNRASPPAALMPATRAWRLATSPKGYQTGFLETTCHFRRNRLPHKHLRSPPACDLDGDRPGIPSGTPAATMRSTRGRTPVAASTRSASINSPSWSARPRLGDFDDAPVGAELDLVVDEFGGHRVADGRSNAGSSRGIASTSVTCAPRDRRVSAISRPIYPLPIWRRCVSTATVGAGSASRNALSVITGTAPLASAWVA